MFICAAAGGTTEAALEQLEQMNNDTFDCQEEPKTVRFSLHIFPVAQI
jgi:hypothetical protein